jgi:cytochrome b subunit of formate dehydrogenase
MTDGATIKTDSSKTLGKGQHRAERAFAQLDRYVAWASALLLFLFFISGFGMTKPDLVSSLTGGLVTWRVAYDMHNTLQIPLMLAFTIHTFSGLRRALLRRTKRRRATAWIAAGIGLAVLGYLLTLALSPAAF